MSGRPPIGTMVSMTTFPDTFSLVLLEHRIRLDDAHRCLVPTRRTSRRIRRGDRTVR